MIRTTTSRLATALSLAMLLCFSLSVALPALAHENEAPIGDAIKDVPLFDAHMHYKEPAWMPYPVESVIELMDKNGVAMEQIGTK